MNPPDSSLKVGRKRLYLTGSRLHYEDERARYSLPVDAIGSISFDRGNVWMDPRVSIVGGVVGLVTFLLFVGSGGWSAGFVWLILGGIVFWIGVRAKCPKVILDAPPCRELGETKTDQRTRAIPLPAAHGRDLRRVERLCSAVSRMPSFGSRRGVATEADWTVQPKEKPEARVPSKKKAERSGPRGSSNRGEHGVWLEPKGLRVRCKDQRNAATIDDFVPYYDLREVAATRKGRLSSGDQAALVLCWFLCGFLLVWPLAAVLGPIWGAGVLILNILYFFGWFVIPIWSRLRAYTVLSLDVYGGHLPGLEQDAKGRALLPLTSRGKPVPDDEVHRLAARISAARKDFFDRAVKEGRSGKSDRSSPSPSPQDRTAAASGSLAGETRAGTDRKIGTSEGLPSRLDLLGELGRGGMATVYKARDRGLDREVAVKVLHESLLSDEEAVARFEREAKLIAGLEHPNLLGIYGVERLGEGRLGLVMPYVRGGTLRDLLRSTGGDGLKPDAVTRITREILKGLAFAHRRGVVHRDIKPGNIFLDEETDRVFIGDFGIARAVEGHTALTQTGTSMGTPNYMAPEQIDSSSEVDGRADLYAVGMMMWEMLTGEQPWGQESLFNVIFKQKTEDLPTPRSLGGSAPEHLLAVWRKATRKDPDDRWATAGEMLEALSRLEPLTKVGLDPEPTRPHPRREEGREVREGTGTRSAPSRHKGSASLGRDRSTAPENQPTRKWNR